MGIANFAVILLLNYRKQQGHYCHDILAMLAEWDEEIPEDVAHLDISKVYDLGGTRNSKKCEVVQSFVHTINYFTPTYKYSNKKIDISFIVHLKKHQLLKVSL